MIASRPRGDPSRGAAIGRVLVATLVVVNATLALCALEARGQTAAQTAVFAGDSVPAPLTKTPGDPARGKLVLVQRDKGHCILCHALPEADVKFAGNIGPPLAGVGRRLDAARIRGRIVDPTRHDSNSVMPPYYRTENLNRVAAAYKGKTALSAQDVEDAVAYLITLK